MGVECARWFQISADKAMGKQLQVLYIPVGEWMVSIQFALTTVKMKQTEHLIAEHPK